PAAFAAGECSSPPCGKRRRPRGRERRAAGHIPIRGWYRLAARRPSGRRVAACRAGSGGRARWRVEVGKRGWNHAEARRLAAAASAAFATVILSRESFPLPATISLNPEGQGNVPCQREIPQDELAIVADALSRPNDAPAETSGDGRSIMNAIRPGSAAENACGSVTGQRCGKAGRILARDVRKERKRKTDC